MVVEKPAAAQKSLWAWESASFMMVILCLAGFVLFSPPNQPLANSFYLPAAILATANFVVLLTGCGSRWERLVMVALIGVVVAPHVSFAAAEYARARGYLDYVRIQQPDGSWREIPRAIGAPYMNP